MILLACNQSEPDSACFGKRGADFATSAYELADMKKTRIEVGIFFWAVVFFGRMLLECHEGLGQFVLRSAVGRTNQFAKAFNKLSQTKKVTTN